MLLGRSPSAGRLEGSCVSSCFLIVSDAVGSIVIALGRGRTYSASAPAE